MNFYNPNRPVSLAALSGLSTGATPYASLTEKARQQGYLGPRAGAPYGSPVATASSVPGVTILPDPSGDVNLTASEREAYMNPSFWGSIKDKASSAWDSVSGTVEDRLKNPDAVKWAKLGADMFDSMNKEEIARNMIAQDQANKAASQALSTLNSVPGMYAMRQQAAQRNRGLAAMAGVR